MSAITGIFRRDGRKVDPELIKKMNHCLSHRGPDGSAVYHNGPVALGHKMLWTTPESLHEKLPFYHENIGLVITADARIDNRMELYEKLGIEDKEDIPDSYYILKSYQKWGENCPEHLTGDFAFVIWDDVNGKLFCARDHIGVKPFYYYMDDEIFIFATEIKALLSLDIISKKLNEKQVAEHLGFLLENKEDTFYKNIHRLAPANTLKLGFKKETFNKYWSLDSTRELQLDSDEAYTNQFLEIFKEVVKCRLRSAFPVGSMLSGGLDTSSVVCTVQTIKDGSNKKFNQYNWIDNSFKTFSAIFDEVPECDERHYIDAVLSNGEFEPYYVNADQISPLGEIDEFFSHGDQPFLFPNHFMLWNLYKEAHKRGTRILLDGFDGDTIVSYGDGIFSDLLKSGKWGEFIKEISETAKLHGIRPYRLLINKSLETFTPKSIKRLRWSLTKFTTLDNRNNKFIHEELIKRTGLIEHLKNEYEKELNIKNSRQLHQFYIESGLIQLELEQLDWIAARFGIEPRHPYYDKRLIEFCLSLPVEQKRKNGFDRLILRRAMKDILPEEIRQRIIKTDFNPNFNRSLLKFEKKCIDNLIIENPSVLEKYVDVPFLQKKYAQYLSGNTENINEIWDIVVLGLWLQKNSI